MHFRLLKEFIIVFLLVSSSIFKAQELSYTLSPGTFENHAALQVEASISVNASRITSLLFRNEFWGESNLKRHLKDFKVLTKKVTIADTIGDHIKLNYSDKLKEIQFSYKIVSEGAEELTFSNSFRPFVSNSSFHAFNFSLFVTPKLKDNDKINVEIIWKNFEENYVIHNSFGSNEKRQSIKNISFKNFYESVFIGGDYVVDQFNVKNKKVTFVSPLNWETFDRDLLFILSKEVLTKQIDFWNDKTNSPYSIILSPEHELKKGASYIGTGLTNSFASLISDNGQLDETDILNLVNHEILHHWIGGKIVNENEEKQYWFSEGFTEYYNYKLASKEKILNKDSNYFITKFNEIVHNLLTSEKREIPNHEMNYDNFWNKEGYEKIPYNRGAIFAFYLDIAIQKESKGNYSLDNLMRDFLKDSIENNKKMNEDYFIEKAIKYYPNIKNLLTKHIIEGKLMPLESFYNENQLEFKINEKEFNIKIPILLKSDHKF